VFAGIAFLPRQDAAATRTALERVGVALSESRPYVDRSDGEEHVLWENMTLTQISSPVLTTFICDYKYRTEMNESRRSARSELVDRQGGPLGLIELAEIRLAARDPARWRSVWSTVLQDDTDDDGMTVAGQPGVRIFISKGEEDGVTAMSLRVRSLERAASWLEVNGLLGARSEGSAEIAPKAVQGLTFNLIE